MASEMAHSRAGHALTPISWSFRLTDYFPCFAVVRFGKGNRSGEDNCRSEGSNTVVMEANGYRMTLVEKQNKHYLVLAENSDAQFYQDGKWFVFQDIEKKEHKFSLVHMEKIVAPQ